MKLFIVFMAFASLMIGTTWATESVTDCPMMRESNERNNPKTNLDSVKSQSNKDKSGVVRQ
jgi:hypothetical protein